MKTVKGKIVSESMCRITIYDESDGFSRDYSIYGGLYELLSKKIGADVELNVVDSGITSGEVREVKIINEPKTRRWS